MEDLNLEELQTKLEITGIAVDLYVEQNGEFTLNQIAKELKIDVAEIFNYFPNKKAILEFYYTSLVIRYKLMIEEIEDFESYMLSEKLSNFIFASFDMMEEKQEFVEATFNKMIRYSYAKTEYSKRVEALLESFFREDTGISASSTLVMNGLFFQLMRAKYLYLVSYWIRDESKGKERTMELTDKLTAFIQEVMYNSVADKGFDLMKLWISNATSNCTIPFWDKISSKIEIR